jgi:hypothetical protein
MKVGGGLTTTAGEHAISRRSLVAVLGIPIIGSGIADGEGPSTFPAGTVCEGGQGAV